MKYFPHDADTIKDCKFQIACHQDSLRDFVEWRKETGGRLSDTDVIEIANIKDEIARLIHVAYKIACKL